MEEGGEQATGWIRSPELRSGTKRFHVLTHEGVKTLLRRVAGDPDSNIQPQRTSIMEDHEKQVQFDW